ncbi:MAG TPA: hypothetical protein VLC96_18990 [Flavobacterium sp.]|nr:hypothetical protein [Flavobacterium sp.]
MQTTLTQEEPFDGRTAIELALGCFTIGTLFFILLLTLKDPSFVFIIGCIFIIMALPLNIIMFLHLLHYYYIFPQIRKYIAQKIIILLGNIPIAILYYTILHSYQLL